MFFSQFNMFNCYLWFIITRLASIFTLGTWLQMIFSGFVLTWEKKKRKLDPFLPIANRRFSLFYFQQSLPMPRKNLAKMAAALDACKELHRIGELDDNLLPVRSLSDEDSDSEEEEPEPGGKRKKAGTKKRKRRYERKVITIDGCWQKKILF